MTLLITRISSKQRSHTANAALAAVVALSAAATFASCGGDSGNGTVGPTPVASVVVSASDSAALHPTETVNVTAVTKDANGGTLTGRTVTWSSSSIAVATVTSAGVVTAVAPGVAAIRATSEGKVDSVFVAVRPPAIQLQLGSTAGDLVFPDGDTDTGGQGQTIDGTSCLGGEQLAFHIHSQVSLFIDGQQVAVPKAIGVTNAVITNGQYGPYVSNGTCFYWIHTHDAAGVIHVEAPVQTTLTLGNLFDIWGRTLSSTELAGHQGEVRVWIDSAGTGRSVRYTGDPRTVAFGQHREIMLEVGAPRSAPPQYTFPTGY